MILQHDPAQMTPRERVLGALAGEELDHPPISIWRHFPEQDQTAQDLAASTLRWQARFQFDFIKLMPPGDYPTIDWGATSEYRGAPGGTRMTTRYPVRAPEDWRRTAPDSVLSGFNAHVINACQLVREGVGPDVPILQTVFSPLTIAHKLSNGAVIQHLRSHPDLVREALETIRNVTMDVTRASLAAGADGVFFASQCATSEMLTQAEYETFGVPFDLPVLEAARESGSIFTLIHIHGNNTYFALLATYPGHAINWHDEVLDVSVNQFLSTYPQKAAVRGIEQGHVARQSPDDVKNEVIGTRDEAADRRILIGPGCVIPVATPEENILAAIEGTRRPGRAILGTRDYRED
jgi:uroporphyrinogen decarboxylase